MYQLLFFRMTDSGQTVESTWLKFQVQVFQKNFTRVDSSPSFDSDLFIPDTWNTEKQINNCCFFIFFICFRFDYIMFFLYFLFHKNTKMTSQLSNKQMNNDDCFYFTLYRRRTNILLFIGQHFFVSSNKFIIYNE